MDSQEYHAALAALAWQVELGVDEAVGDTPVDRYALAATAPAGTQGTQGAKAVPTVVSPQAASAQPASPGATPAAPAIGPDPVAEAETAAAAAADLAGLKAAMAAYPYCELRHGARNLVFADGVGGAPLMVIGEAPGRDEDREGRPFVGRAGLLLDRMLAAIGRDRVRDVYITNVLPWRPPQNRDPSPEEIAMLVPFLRRHIALADPQVLVIMGNIPAQALLGRRGVTRLRGSWQEAENRPAMPMFHPAYLLRNPAAKRASWADLLDIRARLEATA